jgi:hypothetical protein
MLDHQGAAGILPNPSDERNRGEAFPTIKINLWPCPLGAPTTSPGHAVATTDLPMTPMLADRGHPGSATAAGATAVAAAAPQCRRRPPVSAPPSTDNTGRIISASSSSISFRCCSVVECSVAKDKFVDRSIFSMFRVHGKSWERK